MQQSKWLNSRHQPLHQNALREKDHAATDETKVKDAQEDELSVLTWAGYSTRLMQDDNRWGVEGIRLNLDLA